VWGWLLHVAGVDDPASNWYGFWSGFGSDLGELAAVGVLLRRFNCHVRGCWRLGRHRLPGTSYVICHRHHPDHPRRRAATAAEVAFHYGRTRS
jgi:hypothetical protein